MADSGGLPQVTQVRLIVLLLVGVGWGRPSLPPVPGYLITVCACLALLQPGKLTEAFKYFLQGMGYSEYSPPALPPETSGGHQGWC